MNDWVCIDFGTCNTTAAIAIDGAPHVVSYSNSQLFPTIACVLDNGEIEVCQNATSLRQTHPETFKQEFKLQIADSIDINKRTYTDIVREILSFVKGCAEIENNNQPVTKVILTVPAIYTESDKRKTVMQKAALGAGFSDVEFLYEPQAAAYHYADVSGRKSTGISLIYDLGGGTFDPALLDMTIPDQPKLLGYDSGVKCGGQFFDKEVYNHIKVKANETGKPLLRSHRLNDYDACRRLKEALSIKQTATQCFSNGEMVSLSRAELNELIKPLIRLTLQSCDNLIHSANKHWSDVSQILFVGGSTAIPAISEMLQKHLISHNATSVKIIRNLKGEKGEYNYTLATCLGGISKKIIPAPPPPEKIAQLFCNGQPLQLKKGENRFGRGSDMDFCFQDPSMSRYHFSITVTTDANGKLCYTLTTHSQSKATIINNMEALDLRYAPISRVSTFLMDGFTIKAGSTTFVFKKQI